jgi:hypothetical protein
MRHQVQVIGIRFSGSRWMNLRRPGTCKVCGSAIPGGELAYWDASARTVTCEKLRCRKADGLITTKLHWDGASGSEIGHIMSRETVRAEGRKVWSYAWTGERELAVGDVLTWDTPARIEQATVVELGSNYVGRLTELPSPLPVFKDEDDDMVAALEASIVEIRRAKKEKLLNQAKAQLKRWAPRGRT